MEVNLSDRQIEAYDATEQFVLYGGAKGGGKSWFLCVWAFTQATKYRGNRGFLGRKRGVDFTNTTLETWKKAIPANLYRINEQKKRIFIDEFSSYIDYGGLDSEEDVQKFNSAEYGFVGIDQAEEVSRDIFAMVRGTLRHKLPGGVEPSYQVILTANPAQCWLKDDFIINPKRGHRFIQALPTDNAFLAKEYISNLEEAYQYRPELLEAYLRGSWDELAGSDIIIQAKHVRRSLDLLDDGPTKKRIVVCDPARFGNDETVVYVMEQTSHIKIIDTDIVSHKTLMDTAGRLLSKQKEFEANLIVVDTVGIGSGIEDRLYELNANVFPIVSSKAPTTTAAKERYLNLRSQMWFYAAEQFAQDRIICPRDEELINQLTRIRYGFGSNGKLKVESKEEIKKDSGKSPDRADAFVMGVFGMNIADPLSWTEERTFSKDHQGKGIPLQDNDGISYCYDEY